MGNNILHLLLKRVPTVKLQIATLFANDPQKSLVSSPAVACDKNNVHLPFCFILYTDAITSSCIRLRQRLRRQFELCNSEYLLYYYIIIIQLLPTLLTYYIDGRYAHVYYC